MKLDSDAGNSMFYQEILKKYKVLNKSSKKLSNLKSNKMSDEVNCTSKLDCLIGHEKGQICRHCHFNSVSPQKPRESFKRQIFRSNNNNSSNHQLINNDKIMTKFSSGYFNQTTSLQDKKDSKKRVIKSNNGSKTKLPVLKSQPWKIPSKSDFAEFSPQFHISQRIARANRLLNKALIGINRINQNNNSHLMRNSSKSNEDFLENEKLDNNKTSKSFEYNPSKLKGFLSCFNC